MIELIFTIISGILIGILTGLLPALPVYTGPFLLYYFSPGLPLEYLMIFWLAVVSGSQFFGSVATITTKIPGEESSSLYLKDIDLLSLSKKNMLLYDTALGSFVAGMISLLFVWTVLNFLNIGNVPYLSSINFQIVCYTLALVSFSFFNKNILVTVFLVILGLILSPNSNYSLPDYWFTVSSIFQGYTFYMVVLGMIIIPEVFFNDNYFLTKQDQMKAVRSKIYSIWQGVKSSVIGLFAGLIPGPSAFLAALAAYKTAGKDPYKKIVAAETANNASVITCALPLLMIALPINQNTIIFSNVMDIRSVNIVEAIWQPSFVSILSVLDLTMISLSVCMIIYFWLSTHLINFYVNVIELVHSKLKFIMIAIITALIALDVSTADITVSNYIMLLSFFTLFGIALKKFKINSLPMLFAIILGDKIIWLYTQFYMINFL